MSFIVSFLLVGIVSYKKFAAFLIFGPLYTVDLFFFFWLLLRFFFIAGFKWFDYDIPQCSFLHVSCVWALLSFLYSICWFIMFIKFGKILAVASSNKFRPLYPFAPLLQELQSGTLKLSHSSLILPFSFISVFYFRLFLLLCFQVH